MNLFYSSLSVRYNIVGGSAVAHAGVVLSNDAAGANGVTYAVKFSVPATGALAAGSGTIELSAAAGTFLASAKCEENGATVTDLTTKASTAAASCFGSASTKTGLLGLGVPVAIGAGDEVIVTVSGLANLADVGPESLSVVTSSSPPSMALQRCLAYSARRALWVTLLVTPSTAWKSKLALLRASGATTL